MKKLFMIACMMLASTAMFAEKGATTLGAHAAYNIDEPNNIGVGVQAGYEFMDNIRAIAGFDYYLKKDNFSLWNVDLDVAYLFKFGKLAAYPLAGVNLCGAKYDVPEITVMGVTVGGGSSSDSKLGLTLGAGVEYQLSESLALKAEYNYKTQWDGNSFLKLGVVIPF